MYQGPESENRSFRKDRTNVESSVIKFNKEGTIGISPLIQKDYTDKSLIDDERKTCRNCSFRCPYFRRFTPYTVILYVFGVVIQKVKNR